MLRAPADSDHERALALDAEDELAPFRAAFHLPEENGAELVYLCGHSLGPMPRSARELVTRELDAWSERGVEAHFDPRSNWFTYHERFAEPLAELIGATSREVVAMNSLTANLHLMLVSFFRPAGRRDKILIERGAFPSDRYAVQSQLRFRGLEPGDALIEFGPVAPSGLLDPDQFDMLLAERGDQIALVLLPGVQFLTGQVQDLEAYTTIAHGYGCTIGFDLAHAVGNVPLDLGKADADFAVWCSYKYLNAGPGAVAGCFVNRRWIDARLPRFEGWWGHDKDRRFDLEPSFRPAQSAEAWQLSNPSILAMAPLAASLELYGEATLARLREKSIRLTGFLDERLRSVCGDRIEILTPSRTDERGCQLSIRIETSETEFALRLRRLGVVADWRPPDILRLAPAPFFNSFCDVDLAARAVGRALEGS